MPKDGYFRSETENVQTITLPSKKTSKPSAGPVGCSFEKNCLKNHAKSPINSLNDQKRWAKFFHSRETSKNCSSEHFGSSFDNPESIFCLFVQTFLLEVRRYFKKRFFYKFLPPIFFSVLVGCFFETLFFLSKDRKTCSNSKTDKQIQLFLEKLLLIKKCLWTRGLQLWQLVKKLPD